MQFTNDIFNYEVRARLDFEMPLLFEACPFLERQSMSRLFINRLWNNLAFFIRECIDNGYYIYITIDTFYIDCYTDYLTNHGEHPILILGYDMDDQTLLAADNFSGGQYAVRPIAMKQFEQAYNIYKSNEFDMFMDGVTLLRYKNHNQFWNWHHDYFFDSAFMKNSIRDFFDSKGLNDYGIIGIEQWKGTTLVYGLNCYKAINNYLEKLPYYDRRTFFVFWEHKKIMTERIRYMMKHNIISNDDPFSEVFRQIEHDADILQKLWVKFGIMRKEKTLCQIYSTFNDIIEREKLALNRLLTQL